MNSRESGKDGESEQFIRLVERTAARLNACGMARRGMSPRAAEELVSDIAAKCARGTPFEGAVFHASKKSKKAFPDITVGERFGIEVKSVKSGWQSCGNSIFEGTKKPSIERIWIIFANLGGEPEFRAKPYEDCIADVKDDHAPRYRIDMTIQERGRKTLFEQTGAAYGEICALNRKERLRTFAPRLKWHNLVKPISSCSAEERDGFIAEACCFFPQLFGSSKKKYEQYAMWLAGSHCVLSHCARDDFSSGGRVFVGGMEMPAVVGSFLRLAPLFRRKLEAASGEELRKFWQTGVQDDRLAQWLDLVSRQIKPPALEKERLKEAEDRMRLVALAASEACPPLRIVKRKRKEP